MAETLRDRVEQNLKAGVDQNFLRDELKASGFRNEDFDIPIEQAKLNARGRLSVQTGIPTPDSLFPVIESKPEPVAAPVALTPTEPVALPGEGPIPTTVPAGDEGTVVKRVGGILQPLDTAKMVGGAVAGFLGKPGAQAAREGAKEAVRTAETAKQATLQNLERKRRRQKEMGLTDTEAFVVDAAEDAYELGTGLASILGTGLAGVPVPAGMEKEMQPFKMGEDVGKQIIPGILGGIAATIEDPAVAGRAPLTTLLNVYPAARAYAKWSVVAGIPAEAQLAIPNLVARTEGYLANKFGNAWRLFINASETGSPEANVLWKKLKESATTIDSAFNEALPKVESAILGERRLGIGPRKAPTGPDVPLMVEPAESASVPGPRFGKAEKLNVKAEKPTTLVAPTVSEVNLPQQTITKLKPAFEQLQNQLADAALELSDNVRRSYRVELGRVANPSEIRNIVRNATVEALRDQNLAAIVSDENLLRKAAEQTVRLNEQDSKFPVFQWQNLEKKLRSDPFGTFTKEQEIKLIERLTESSPDWNNKIKTPEFRNTVVRNSIERTQNGIKKAMHEGLLENEAASFMKDIADRMGKTFADEKTRRQAYANLINDKEITIPGQNSGDPAIKTTTTRIVLQKLQNMVENNEQLPAFIPSTKSSGLLEDLKGMLDISKPGDKKLMGYLESMAPTPYTYSPSAQGLIAAPLVADAMASSANDLLAGTQYLLSTLPKRTALPLNLKSAYNNFVGNETVMAMAYGNMPGTTIPVAIAKELITSKPGSKMSKFKEAGKRVGLFDTDVLAKDIENFTRLQEGFLAKGQRGIEKVLGPTTKAFGSLSAGADKLYKTYTGYKEFNRGLEYIDELNEGQYVQFATGQNTAQRITREGDGLLYLKNYSLGKEVGKAFAIGFDSANLSNEGYNALARYAKTVADSYFFDYGEVPGLLQMIRKAPVVGVGTPFFTWSYKAVDLPWKQGLGMATIRGPDRIVSNSKLINFRQAKDSTLIALRRAGLTALAKREMETDPELNRVMAYNPKEPGSKIFKSLGDPGIYAEMNLGQADPFGNTLNAATIVSNVASNLYERIAGTSTDAQLEAILKNPNAATEEQFTALAAKLRRDSIYKKETLPLTLSLFGLGMTFFSEKYVDLLKAQEQGNSTDFAKLALDLYVPGMAKTAMAYMNDELVEGLMKGAVPGSPIAESTAQYAVRNFLGPGYATVNTPQQYKRFRQGVQKEMEAVLQKKQKQIAIKRKEKADSADLDKEEETLDLIKDIVEQSLEEMDSYWEKAVPEQEE